MSSTQNQFFKKTLVETKTHAKFDVLMAFGLGVRLGGKVTLD